MSINPKISVIVPVYNVGKWLQRFYDSLTAQTLTDYEVWMVDDGSTDESGEICTEFAAKDSRFHVIHQKNAGAALARNTAIPHASGEYLYFFDPDDWIEPTLLEKYYKIAKMNNLQYLISGYCVDNYYSKDKYYREKRISPNKIFKTQQEFREYAHILLDKTLLYNPWNKLFERKFIVENGIKFPDEYWDDFLFNLAVCRDVERVGCLDNLEYHFMKQRAESEGAKYRKDLYEKREDENIRIYKLFKYWNLSSDEITEVIDRRYSERLVGCIENLTNKKCTLPKKEIKKQIKEIISAPHAQKAIRNTKPNTLMMRLMLFPLKHKMTNLCYIECKFISFVKRNNGKIFAKLKANR